MTGDIAARWAATVIPSWLYRWLMPAAWLGAVVMSVWSAGDLRCSADDPSICGPDRTFALAMVVCIGSLVLWWWRPALPATAGVLFLLLELQFDDEPNARLAWTIYGSACAALLIWIVLSRRQQLQLGTSLPRRPVTIPAARTLGLTGRLLVASGLVLAGAAVLGLMRWQDQREDDHLRRAVEQTGVVTSRSDDGDHVLRFPDGSTRTVALLDDYPDGASVPVLTDPEDQEWIRPKAEPADYTDWYTVAGCAWGTAILLVLRDLQRRRVRRRRTWTAPGLPVHIEPDASGSFAIHSVDGSILLGFLKADLDDEVTDAHLYDALDFLDDGEEEFAPAELKRQWKRTLQLYRGEALLVGELVEGSWPTIVFRDQVLRPVGPFRAPRRSPWKVESASGVPEHLLADGDASPWSASPGTEPATHLPSGSAVEPARDPPVLPWEIPLKSGPWWERPALVAVLMVGPMVVGALAAWGEWVAALTLTVAGWRLLSFLGERVFYRVVASATDVRIRTGWQEQVLPWRSVESIEIDGDRLNLVADNDWHVVGGFDRKDLARIAGVFEALRLRSNNGLPAQPASRRQAPGMVLEGGYLVVCVLVLGLLRWGPF
jgi:hypothetical protein